MGAGADDRGAGVEAAIADAGRGDQHFRHHHADDDQRAADRQLFDFQPMTER